MTVNSLTSVSLDPCLLHVCPRRGSATGNDMKESRAFAVNLLAKSQRQLAGRFVS
jgi:3-hydroxy-9,10-secoandrosta-1,3,5(10)-triene-9,17-dione monooxygenase reductase component